MIFVSSMDKTLAVIFIYLSILIPTAVGIKCYYCYGAEDCADPFRSTGHVSTCTGDVCAKIHRKSGADSFQRYCASVGYNTGCWGDDTVSKCYCKTDYCNGQSSISTTSLMLYLSTAAVLLPYVRDV